MHYNSRQQQSQTLFQDCLDAQNKRATLRVRTRNNRKTLLNYFNCLKQIASFWIRPSRPIRKQSLWSSICRIIVRTQRRDFDWVTEGWENVSGWKCLFLSREHGLFLSVNVDSDRWLVSKMTCTTCGRNRGKCRFGKLNATHFIDQVYRYALSFKLSPTTELMWRTSAYSQKNQHH